MGEERYKLSKSAIPSQLSDFCDENGRMLNSEVVSLLNEHDKQYEANWKMFFLIKEQQHTIESLEKEKVELMEDCACQYRRIQKLESEKEELEISINLFEADIIEKDNTIKRLQNQLDFIQNNISNAIQHKKTELEQKALKEIISDYNEFLLGHKGAE